MYQLPDTNLSTDFVMGLVIACSAIPILKPRIIKMQKADIFRR
jgi:hypothetical protein